MMNHLWNKWVLSLLIKVNKKGTLTNSPADILEMEAGFSYGFLQALQQEVFKFPFSFSHVYKQTV